MKTAGIICEFNPFHKGHAYLIDNIRRLYGAEGIVCVMSGNFVQRGDFALISKAARAEAAVMSGADLVLELPVVWALSSAQRFARGGVRLLSDSNAADMLAFGSECGDISLMTRAADLTGGGIDRRILEFMDRGSDYAAARHKAVCELDPDAGAVLATPNDTLGVEYIRECKHTGLTPVCVKRFGSEHGGYASAGWIRENIVNGGEEFMTPSAALIYRRECDAGRAPVTLDTLDTAVMSALRKMSEDELRKLPDVSEGLEFRLYKAARQAVSAREFCDMVKTRRYAHSRIRRIMLSAYLGLTRELAEPAPPYARVLAFNDTGRAILRRMGGLPVITKPADGAALGGYIEKYLNIEALADDLYALAYPSAAERRGGSLWRSSPRFIKSTH